MPVDIPSVEQLFLNKFGGRTVDLMRRDDPDAIPSYAEILLKGYGVPLIGAPGLVAYAKAKAIEEVEAVFDFKDASAAADRRKVGRPRVSQERDLASMAAFSKFTNLGLGPTAARREAAKLLGSTASTIEKGVRRYVRRVHFMQRATKIPAQEIVQMHVIFIVWAGMALDRCAEERRAILRRTRRN